MQVASRAVESRGGPAAPVSEKQEQLGPMGRKRRGGGEVGSESVVAAPCRLVGRALSLSLSLSHRGLGGCVRSLEGFEAAHSWPPTRCGVNGETGGVKKRSRGVSRPAARPRPAPAPSPTARAGQQARGGGGLGGGHIVLLRLERIG